MSQRRHQRQRPSTRRDNLSNDINDIRFRTVKHARKDVPEIQGLGTLRGLVSWVLALEAIGMRLSKQHILTLKSRCLGFVSTTHARITFIINS
jgi:hypothetical protein